MQLPMDLFPRVRALLAFSAMLLLVCWSATAFALDPKDKWEGPFDFAATGGTFLEDTCAAGPFGCVAGLFDNQGDLVTEISSSEMAGIPDNVQVVKAYLVWMGSIDYELGTPDNQVTLTLPQGNPYTIVADETQLEEISYQDYDADDRPAWFRYFTYRVDVTEIIRRHNITDGKPLNGGYTVGDFNGFAGEPYKKRQVVLGGWSIILVYSVPDGEPRRIYFYTEFSKVRDEVLSLLPSGFLAPENAGAKLTLFVGEGDQSISGMGLDGTYSEQLSFNATPLQDACNPVDNVYNSTINTNLPASAGGCRENVYSVDLDTFFISNLLNLGDTDAEIDLSLGQDQVITNYFILSISTKRPDFDIPNEPEKTASIESGDSLYPGQSFTYFIHVQNTGEDVATKVRVRDTLPQVVDYIPGSTYVVEPSGERRQIEDGPNGAAPCLTGIEIADSMPPGATYRRMVEIGARLRTEAQGVTKETIVENTGEIISGRGDVYFTNGGVPVMHRVRLESFEGTLYFGKGDRHPDSRFIGPGDTGVIAAHINLKALEGDVSLNSLAFTPTEGSDHLIVTQAELYWDKNNNGEVDDEDEQLGSPQTWSSSGLIFANFDALGQLDANEQQNLLLTVDIAENAQPDMMVQLQLLDSDVNVRGFKSGLPFSCARLFIPGEDVGVSMELGYENPPSGYLAPGMETTVMQLKLRTYTQAVTVLSLTFSSEGTVYNPSEITSMVLVEDANGNGEYDDDEFELGDAVSFTTDDSAFDYGFNLPIPAGEQANVILVATFSATVAEEKTFRVNIGANEMLDAGSASVAGAPIEGSLFTFANMVEECVSDEECSEALGPTWICDQIAGICRPTGDVDGDSTADGDIPDGDGGADGDVTDGDIEDEDGGGGCSQPALPGAATLFALLALIALLHRRRV
jgi:uncharacterized repeat protein (TIGR01451 family)